MFKRHLPLALLLLNPAWCLATSVEMNTVVMQLRSKVNSNNDEMLSKMIEYTAGYMDDYFGAYYINTQPENYFSYTGLDVNSFGIHGVTGSFISTLEIDGVLFFNSDPPPSQVFIQSLVENAFQGSNFQLFLDGLLQVDNEFLTSLTHIIIDIGGRTLTEKDLEGLAAGTEDETSGTPWDIDEWSEIAIYATAGVVGALLIMALLCACRCLFLKGKRRVEDNTEPIKLRSIEIPTAVTHTNSKPEQDYTPQHAQQIRPARKTNIENGYNSRDRSLSPVRSIASQDSSKFTYNPAGTSMLSKASFSVGSLSNIDMQQSIDLEAWQRNDAISSLAPPPFGHDISAIEQKDRDLSLIEEGDEEDPRLGERREYITRRARSEFEARKYRAGLQKARPSNQQPKQTNRVIDYSTEESNSLDADSSSDVINDLRNLSRQIETHRRSNNSRR